MSLDFENFVRILAVEIGSEDIAAAAAYLASDDARLVNGHVLVVDGGQTTSGGNNRFIKSGSGMLRGAGKWDKY